MPKLNMTVDLRPEDIKTAIRQYIAREFEDMEVSEVNFKVREAYHSSDPRETSISAGLEGATAKLRKKEKTRDSDNYQNRNMQNFQDK